MNLNNLTEKQLANFPKSGWYVVHYPRPEYDNRRVVSFDTPPVPRPPEIDKRSEWERRCDEYADTAREMLEQQPWDAKTQEVVAKLRYDRDRELLLRRFVYGERNFTATERKDITRAVRRFSGLLSYNIEPATAPLSGRFLSKAAATKGISPDEAYNDYWADKTDPATDRRTPEPSFQWDTCSSDGLADFLTIGDVVGALAETIRPERAEVFYVAHGGPDPFADAALEEHERQGLADEAFSGRGGATADVAIECDYEGKPSILYVKAREQT